MAGVRGIASKRGPRRWLWLIPRPLDRIPFSHAGEQNCWGIILKYDRCCGVYLSPRTMPMNYCNTGDITFSSRGKHGEASENVISRSVTSEFHPWSENAIERHIMLLIIIFFLRIILLEIRISKNYYAILNCSLLVFFFSKRLHWNFEFGLKKLKIWICLSIENFS